MKRRRKMSPTHLRLVLSHSHSFPSLFLSVSLSHAHTYTVSLSLSLSINEHILSLSLSVSCCIQRTQHTHSLTALTSFIASFDSVLDCIPISHKDIFRFSALIGFHSEFPVSFRLKTRIQYSSGSSVTLRSL